MAQALLEIEDLHVDFPTQGGVLHAVDGVSLSLDEGDVLGIVGESGSGKSVTMLAVMGLVAFPGQVRAKTLRFGGRDLLRLSERARRKVIGADVAMIFQEPTTSLNPCFTIGFQLAETLRLHLGLDRKAARKRSIALLDSVGIPAAESRLSDFPHQLSGGMNQRVMIAMAIACNPKLLIADEPTTALDVTVQAQILALLKELTREANSAMILITHDLGVVARYADRVAVMYGGRIVETAPARQLYKSPRHPYTRGLMLSVPRLDGDTARPLVPIEGQPPDLASLPPGCPFAPRCKDATERCLVERPPLFESGPNHFSACFYRARLAA